MKLPRRNTNLWSLLHTVRRPYYTVRYVIAHTSTSKDAKFQRMAVLSGEPSTPGRRRKHLLRESLKLDDRLEVLPPSEQWTVQEAWAVEAVRSSSLWPLMVVVEALGYSLRNILSSRGHTCPPIICRHGPRPRYTLMDPNR